MNHRILAALLFVAASIVVTPQASVWELRLVSHQPHASKGGLQDLARKAAGLGLKPQEVTLPCGGVALRLSDPKDNDVRRYAESSHAIENQDWNFPIAPGELEHAPAIVKQLNKVEGITVLRIRGYISEVWKAKACRWRKLEPEVLKALDGVDAEVVPQRLRASLQMIEAVGDVTLSCISFTRPTLSSYGLMRPVDEGESWKLPDTPDVTMNPWAVRVVAAVASCPGVTAVKLFPYSMYVVVEKREQMASVLNAVRDAVKYEQSLEKDGH